MARQQRRGKQKGDLLAQGKRRRNNFVYSVLLLLRPTRGRNEGGNQGRGGRGGKDDPFGKWKRRTAVYSM